MELQSQPLALEVGQWHEIAQGETRRHSISLERGDVLRLEIDQTEVDVVVAIDDPARRKILDFDSETGRFAPEILCFEAEQGGKYHLRLDPFRGGGRYRIAADLVDGSNTESGSRAARQAARACAAATRDFVVARTQPLERAVVDFESASRQWLRAGETASAAMALRDAGLVRSDLNQPDAAIETYEQALELAREVDNAFIELSIRNRLGLALLEIDATERADDMLTEALEIAQATGDDYSHGSALLNLSRVALQRGEPFRSIELIQKSMPIWQRLGDDGEHIQARINLADALGVVDRHQEALDVLDQAERLAERLGDALRQSDVASAQGWQHYLRGEPATGVPLIQHAVELRRQQGQLNGEASALDRLGTLHQANSDLEAAETAVLRAIELSEESGNEVDAAGSRLSLGCIYQRMGRLTEAAAELATARRYLVTVDRPLARSQLEYCSAQVARLRGQDELALSHIEAALVIVDRLRGKARALGQLSDAVWLWQDYAQLEVDLLLELYRTEGDHRRLIAAVEASDRHRARSLAELVIESARQASSKVPARLRTEERRWQYQLNELAHQLSLAEPRGADGGDRIGQLERQIRATNLRLDEARARMRLATPLAEDVDTVPVASLAMFQGQLEAGTAVLYYDLGVNDSTLFVITRGSLEVHELASQQVIDRQANGLHAALKEPQSDGQWQTMANSLTDLVLPSSALPRDIERLLVIGEGMLLYTPFATLSAAALSESSARRWLDRLDIAYAPSAAVFAALRQRRDQHSDRRWPQPKTVAVFADPAYGEPPPPLPSGSASPVARSVAASRQPLTSLRRLPASAREAAAILALASDSSLSLLGHRATKQAALATDLRRYRYVHFASHARIDEQIPALSSLVLSTVDADGQAIDGELRLHEIFRLRLAADLAVLSGCQTALGKQVRGNGILGLSRGFFYAGSSRLLVSLWPVDDEATAELMAEFYRRLLTYDETPATALRQAQLWLRRQPRWQAPYYWAPFVLQGDF